MSIYQKIINIQSALKAPKSQRNTFGNYNYRKCEDILEALKPLLKAESLMQTITDEIVLIGDRFYVVAIVIVTDGKDKVSTQAYARESESKKGMDDAQITGSASSYARKYALNGMWQIDDTQDADSHDNTDTGKKAKAEPTPKSDDKPWLNATDKEGKLTKAGEATANKLASGHTTWSKIEQVCKVSKKDKEAIESRSMMLIEELNNTKQPF